MADRILVCVSALQVTVARHRRGRLADCVVCPHDESGVAAFDEFLAPHAGLPVHIMADVVEEDYRFESLPHAFGADRRDMAQRKLRQHYRNTPYAAAWLLGRDREKRRDDRYLFSALTNPNLLAPWLQVVSARGMPVAGIFMLPIVSATLLDALRIKAAHLLLVSLQSGGLRLTFFRDGCFRLSRLTRGDSGRAADRARFITDEISNTRVYLHALRSARLDEPLTLLLLDRNDELAEATETIARDNPSIDCIRLGREDLAARLKIPRPMLDLTADAIYLQLLAMRIPACNLAPVSVTAGFRWLKLRHAIHAAAGMTALAGAGWSGINLWQAYDAHVQTAGLARETASLQARYQEARRRFPAAPTTAQNLQRTVELAQQLREGARTPEAFMHIVSTAIEGAPGIEVSGLTWKHGVGESEAGAGAKPVSPGMPAVSGAAAGRRQSGIVAGEVKPLHGDYRSAVAAIRGFADRLGRHPAVAEARIVKLPLNVDPALALTGNTLMLDSRERRGAMDFKVLVVLKSGL